MGLEPTRARAVLIKLEINSSVKKEDLLNIVVETMFQEDQERITNLNKKKHPFSLTRLKKQRTFCDEMQKKYEDGEFQASLNDLHSSAEIHIQSQNFSLSTLIL